VAYASGHLAQRRAAGRRPILVVIAFAGALFFLDRSGPLDNSALRVGVEDTAAPMLTYLSMPLRGVETFVETRRDRARAFEENVGLKAELRRLQDAERERDSLTRKLEAMRLHITMPEVASHSVILARAVTETSGPFQRAALINTGTRDGIRAGSAVLSTNGLYGHVLRTGQRSSRVLRLTDSNSRVAVKNERTRSRAILSGDDSPRPTLAYIDNAETFRPGDFIVTSGDDGVLPQGLPVGFVAADGRVDLSESGRTADWVRIYVRDFIPAPGEADDSRSVLRIIKVPVEAEPVSAPDMDSGE